MENNKKIVKIKDLKIKKFILSLTIEIDLEDRGVYEDLLERFDKNDEVEVYDLFLYFCKNFLDSKEFLEEINFKLKNK